MNAELRKALLTLGRDAANRGAIWIGHHYQVCHYCGVQRDVKPNADGSYTFLPNIRIRHKKTCPWKIAQKYKADDA